MQDNRKLLLNLPRLSGLPGFHTSCTLCQGRSCFNRWPNFYHIRTPMIIHHNTQKKKKSLTTLSRTTSQWSVCPFTSNTQYMNPLSKSCRASVATVTHSCALISSWSSKRLIMKACFGKSHGLVITSTGKGSQNFKTLAQLSPVIPGSRLAAEHVFWKAICPRQRCKSEWQYSLCNNFPQAIIQFRCI